MLKLYNTLTRKKEVFKPIHKNWVGLYTCGPTVYNYTHIGNLRTYIFEDVLERTLKYNGYKVKRVMNITDVGHLTSDEDIGEDKIEKEAKKEKKTVWQIAKFYTRMFLKDIKKLNIKKPTFLIPATKTIKEQIQIIKILIKKGFAYETSKAIYFNVTKFKNYNKLSRQPLNKKIIAARKNVVIDKEKKHPADFVLWFKLVDRFRNHIMRWPSPWGKGFPGWHIECSAISTKYLGQPFDIHTGGIDHISVHHTNEIAQSEAAYKKPLANYWLHGEFLLIDKKKMAKSKNDFITLKTLEKYGFNPLSFRYLVLTSHYRSKLNFSWQSLKSAQKALNNIYEEIRNIKKNKSPKKTNQKIYLRDYEKIFQKAINDDLNTSKAISTLWQVLKNKNLEAKEKLKLISKFDKILGLNLVKIKSSKIKLSKQLKILFQQREQLRAEKKWEAADKIRNEIEKMGYIIEDTPTGSIIKKKLPTN